MVSLGFYIKLCFFWRKWNAVDKFDSWINDILSDDVVKCIDGTIGI